MVIEGKFSDYFLDPKKALNRIVGLIALIFCAPVLICISVAIKLTSGGPVFLIENLSSGDKGVYASWRFRTSHAQSQSFFYAFLCESRLELLPQLVNVVRGDLSITAVLR